MKCTFFSRLMPALCLAAMLLGGAARARAAEAADPMAGSSIVAATGYSELRDPEKAGAEAARGAKAKLGTETPVVVLVADNLGTQTQAKEALLRGIAREFDARLIFGCSNFGPITEEGNNGSVGVLALAGPIELRTALATGEHTECGRKLGEQLLGESAPATVTEPVDAQAGSLLILLGDCHVPANDALVNGVRQAGGDPAGRAFSRIVGGSAPLEGFQYYEGKVVQGSNMGLLLRGDFQTGVSMKNAPDKPGVIASAGEAIAEARAATAARTRLVLAFDCAARMGQLGGDRARELDAMRQAAAGAPIFGFYGSGEIGHVNSEAPAQGVGVHIATCAIGEAGR